MNIAEFSIKHKYAILALIIAVLLFGIFAGKTLKTELMPDTNPPVINIITAYPGVSANDVAKEVSKPMEEELLTVEGVKKIKSSSQDGLSIVKMEFHYGTKVDIAAVDVQNTINRIKRALPANIQEPQVVKFSTSDKPILTYAISSDKVNLAKVRDLADNEIKSAIQRVDGIASVDTFGGHKSQVNIYINKNALESLNLTLAQVSSAIYGQNASASGGRVSGEEQEYLIRLVQEYDDPNALGNIVISNVNGNLIYLSDVADIGNGTEEKRSEFRFNGQESIALQIMKQSTANTVESVGKVNTEIERLKKDYPFLNFQIADDDSIFTSQVVENMSGTVRDAIILTAFIILISIVAISESFVVSLSMPISFLATLGMMKLAGMELNLITLSALILAVGIMVDDSIIVLENIMRHHHEYGKEMKKAAIDGTKEIMLADIAGTSTHAIVLVPLLFIPGFVGKIFGPLSLTLIFALAASLVVSLTVIPLFSVLIGGRTWPKLQKIMVKIASPYTRLMASLREFYISTLTVTLKHRKTTLVIALILFLMGMQLMRTIGLELLPKIDSGTYSVTIQTFPGTSLDKTSEIAQKTEKIISASKEVQALSTRIGYESGNHYLGSSGALGVNQVEMTVKLSTRKERKETIWEIEELLRQDIAKIPGIKTFVVKEVGGSAISTNAAPIDIRITGQDPKVIYHLANQTEKLISQVPGTVNIYKSWGLDSSEIQLKVNDKRAAELGLSPVMIINEVYGNLEGVAASSIKSESRKDNKIVVRYQPEDRTSLDNLSNVTINTPNGLPVPLRDLVDVEVKQGSNIVTRENLETSIDILGYTYGRTFSHVINDLNQRISEIPMPDGYNIAITGEQTDLSESINDLLFSLLMAVIAVYLLLVAQFRSFIHPITIMTAIPLIMIGVALALLLTNSTVSMSVLLGLILLVGTVVNNSILMLDFILRARDLGQSRTQAIIDSVRVRFRPIMMTAMSQVAGMLPLATGLALGSERFAPLATTVIGGILTATLLTMVVVPVVYTMLDDFVYIFQKKSISKNSVAKVGELN